MGGIGPVEYVVIAFPGNRFKGEIVPAIKARRQRARWQQEADAQAQQGLAALRDQGVLTQEEFDTQKARILAT
jgi:hypothetical protein